MAEATENELRNMLSGLTGVSSDTISLFLADAKRIVVAHGIAVDNACFSQLQRYMTAHLMSGANIGDAKTTNSESVADVSISFQDGAGAFGSLYTTSWEREYTKKKNQVLGLACRCL